MEHIQKSPTDPAFVQNPYAFYDAAREKGSVVFWDDYNMPCAFSYAAVNAILRDRRFGREQPQELRRPVPEHLAPFYAVEAHSMLELEPPRHTRLRGLVLRAFTSRRIKELGPEIERLCHQLIDGFPREEFDLIDTYAQKIPVLIIARLLGVPASMTDDLLAWSNAMVGMYQARRTRQDEDAAVAATNEFVAFLGGYVEKRRAALADDLISHLITAEDDGATLSIDELISTCILLLNAGHEATVHSIGNGVNILMSDKKARAYLGPDDVAGTVEEILRFDPPLHIFTRYAYEDIETAGQTFRRGDHIACVLAAANRDEKAFDEPHKFNPTRPTKPHASFGGGLHFCVGAPLARLEMQISLPVLFDRCPKLRLRRPADYADVYHFHGLKELWVTAF